jgi:hypothetical protein
MILPINLKIFGVRPSWGQMMRIVTGSPSRLKGYRARDQTATMFRATYDRFRDHPMLRVSDVVMVDPRGEKRSDASCSWHPRKHSQTWELVTRLSDTRTTVLSPPVRYRLLMALLLATTLMPKIALDLVAILIPVVLLLVPIVVSHQDLLNPRLYRIQYESFPTSSES